MKHPAHRDSIGSELAEVLSQQAFAGDQFILRVIAPGCAASAKAGQFAHLSCHPLLAMRRPLSIMRANSNEGWVEFLYKVVGQGTRLLAQRVRGDTISLLGPIGQPFTPNPQRRRALLLGGGVGMPPMVFLAEHLKQLGGFNPMVLLGSEVPFPFAQKPSRIMIPGISERVSSCMPLLEDWGVPSRLASLRGYAGCFDGYITDLARCWLDALQETQRQEVAIFSCGPHPMLESVAKLATVYDLPCQVSLEEYMACAVGGCAGCTVQVQTENGPSMKRVCVDGPVFDAYSVFG
jgi:dihydroorotate dehydrogenase electron transfer subunit